MREEIVYEYAELCSGGADIVINPMPVFECDFIRITAFVAKCDDFGWWSLVLDGAYTLPAGYENKQLLGSPPLNNVDLPFSRGVWTVNVAPSIRGLSFIPQGTTVGAGYATLMIQAIRNVPC
jgi:hypothetical protein